jgi:6-pyruvoyltetrahydropterin/6-carboxytetrahydropterin synthase
VTVYLTRRYRLSASHRLHDPRLSDEENRARYGKCNNLHGHGHNYFVEVTVAGKVDPHTGMVCDLEALDRLVSAKVLVPFDHQNLDLVPELRGAVTTTENLCRAILDLLRDGLSHEHLNAVRLDRVRVEETPRNSFEVAADGSPGI